VPLDSGGQSSLAWSRFLCPLSWFFVVQVAFSFFCFALSIASTDRYQPGGRAWRPSEEPFHWPPRLAVSLAKATDKTNRRALKKTTK